MNLEEFIRDTLVQIAKGAKAAGKDVAELGGSVNPASVIQDAKGRTIYQEDGTSAPLVERIAFDIAVTMSSTVEAGSELVRVAVLNPGKRKSETLAPAESRIRFEIPILLPFGDPPD